MAMGLEMMNRMTKSTQAPNTNTSERASGLVCTNCNQPMGENVKFCSNCGTKAVTEQPQAAAQKRFCSNCGAKIEAGMKFCGGCGNKVE
jgi:RNA polymerase subunit RPABC4/transcription elongation factor Spt4